MNNKKRKKEKDIVLRVGRDSGEAAEARQQGNLGWKIPRPDPSDPPPPSSLYFLKVL